MKFRSTGLTAWLALVAPAPLVAADKPAAKAEGLARNAHTVVVAVVRAAERNARLPAAGDAGARPPYRVDGDALTTLYVRAAAAAARRLPARQQVPAFLTGLGLALDNTSILRSNALTAAFYRRVESEAEGKRRREVLGKPTLRKRYDWTQHFFVSAALTELVGAGLAEEAGLLKEQLDMRPGGSGFSFADLSADLGGIAFARRLQKGRLSLDALADRFAPIDFLPDSSGLREGLSARQFAKQFGSTTDDRFRAELARVRKRVESLPGQQAGGK